VEVVAVVEGCGVGGGVGVDEGWFDG